MDKDKTLFVERYLAEPERYANSPYLADPEVLEAIVNPSANLLATPLGNAVIKQAENYAALGAKESKIAELLNISHSTLSRWRKIYPQFDHAIRCGYDIANAEVETALYQRAVGYKHPDVHISNHKGDITVTDITKYYPPDTKAATIWLYNRKPEDWKETKTVEHNVNLLSADERKAKILEYQQKMGIAHPSSGEPVTVEGE